MNRNTLDQAALMRLIYNLGFARDEAKLYLDTHPNEKKALITFDSINTQLKDAMQAYSINFGPLSTDYMMADDNQWDWVITPWPWQREE